MLYTCMYIYTAKGVKGGRLHVKELGQGAFSQRTFLEEDIKD